MSSGFVNPDNTALRTDTSTGATLAQDNATPEKSKEESANTDSISMKDVGSLEKRLADLQSFKDKQLNEKNQEIEHLRKALEEQSIASLPSSKEELAKFQEEKPESYNLIARMIKQQALETQDSLGKKLQEIEEKTNEITFKQGFKELLEIHPDANTIRDSQDFKDWYIGQPQYTIDILTRHDATVDDISFVLSKYKQDKGLVETPAKKKKQQQIEGAEQVINSEKGTPTDKGNVQVTESWIASLTPDEFDKNREIILAAHAKGEVVNDLTG